MKNKSDYTIDYKKEIAEKAIRMQKAEFLQKEIAEILNISLPTLKHWIKDFKDGKYDKPELVAEILPVIEESKSKEIDIRPELKSIAKSIGDLAAITQFLNSNLGKINSNLEKVCIRLDSIYQKNTESIENFETALLEGLKKISDKEPNHDR